MTAPRTSSAAACSLALTALCACATLQRPKIARVVDDAAATQAAVAQARKLDDGRVDDGGAAAIVLLRERTFDFSGKHTSIMWTHEVVKILGEAAFDRASVHLLLPPKARLAAIDARAIAADDTVSTIDPADLFGGEIKLGDKSQMEMRAFRLPRVDVGTIIDLAYRVDVDAAYNSFSEDVAGPLPVREFKVDVAVDLKDVVALKVVNADVVPAFSRHDGLAHAAFEIWNVPAHVDEPFAAPARAREPWWIMRNATRVNDWRRAASLAFAMLTQKLIDDAPEIDVGACNGDFACKVARAVDEVKARTRFTGFAPAFMHRPVTEILATRTANAGEKAFLLYALLKKIGIDARVAGVASAGSGDVDEEFPSLHWFDHTLVAAVDGDRVAWADPSCEFCAPGALPAWDPVGGDALVITPGKQPRAEWWKVNGPVESDPVDGERRKIALRLDDGGAVHIALDETRAGRDALLWMARTRNDDDDDVRASADAAVHAVLRSARVTSAGAVTCDAHHGTCARHIEAEAPRYTASLANGVVAVPLDALGLGTWIDAHDRKTDFVVSTPWVGEDEIDIELPADMTVASLPAHRVARAGIAEVSVSATSEGHVARVVRGVKLSPGRVRSVDVGALADAFDAGAGAAAAVVQLTPAK
jgi:hypothetical protein